MESVSPSIQAQSSQNSVIPLNPLNCSHFKELQKPQDLNSSLPERALPNTLAVESVSPSIQAQSSQNSVIPFNPLNLNTSQNLNLSQHTANPGSFSPKALAKVSVSSPQLSHLQTPITPSNPLKLPPHSLALSQHPFKSEDVYLNMLHTQANHLYHQQSTKPHTACHNTCSSPITKLLHAYIQRTQVTTKKPRYVNLHSLCNLSLPHAYSTIPMSDCIPTHNPTLPHCNINAESWDVPTSGTCALSPLLPPPCTYSPKTSSQQFLQWH